VRSLRDCVLLFWLFLLCLLGGAPSFAQKTTVHSLTVAAQTTLFVKNDEVDIIVAEMNRLIAAKSYPWDIACPTISFRRSGDVISNNNLLTYDNYRNLKNNLAQFVPTANVMIVSGIDCLGETAMGCGVPGEEPLAAGQWLGYDAMVWLHERGHNVGLYHSAEAPADERNTPQDLAFRFMFWTFGKGHFGKTVTECSIFENSKLPSVTTRFAAATPSNPSKSRFPSIQFAGGSENSNAALDPDPAAALAQAGREVGLTQAAFNVVGLPWVERAPLESIMELKPEDLNSIRFIFKKLPNQFWPQGIQTLGFVGNGDDAKIIQGALDYPMPAVSAESSKEVIQQMRILLQAKLAAPKALGVLAKRTNSSSAVETLISAANIEQAERLVGYASANSLSRGALNGLAIADTPRANQFVAAVFNKENTVKVAPLTPGDLNALKTFQERVQKFGVDGLFKVAPQ
jgi:hypothetical protein